MSTRINPPHLQSGPLAFLAVCLAALIVSLRQMFTTRLGSEPWWVGVVLLGMAAFGFAFIEGGWLYIQREVAFADSSIVVRRWIEVLLGRPGLTIPLDADTRSAITLENVRSLRIDRAGATTARLTLGYWDPKQIRDLVDAIRHHRVELAQYWDGEYPPGVS